MLVIVAVGILVGGGIAVQRVRAHRRQARDDRRRLLVARLERLTSPAANVGRAD